MKILNGEINTGLGLIIKPNLTEQDFSNFVKELSAEVFIKNGDYCSYKIKTLNIEGTEFLPIIYFFAGYLTEIHLHSAEEKKLTWADYSSEMEKDKKKRNDDWLIKHLGSLPPYLFNWGSIESVLDLKGGMSFILLRYVTNKVK